MATTTGWNAVETAMDSAHCVAWDGCHKIYVALDEEQARWFLDEYEYVVRAPAPAMLHMVQDWFKDSCPLRFVSSVTTNHANPNAGFEDLIPQAWDGEED